MKKTDIILQENQLAKIKDVSVRFEVTTSTLHYYEKMGLIESSRCESSGYRLYDEAALIRLRQILILRKMDISIGDIKKIFASDSVGAMLSVLEKKLADIDSDVAQLHKLKKIVLDFIQQIWEVNFYNDSDVKLLFDRARAFEISLEDTNMKHLLDIAIPPLNGPVRDETANTYTQFSATDEDDLNGISYTSGELDEPLASIAIEGTPPAPAAKLEAFEIVQFEACRFVGRSVYVSPWGREAGKVYQSAWEHSDWIFAELDQLNEHAIDEAHHFAFITWDKYDDKTKLIGYTVGRFMKKDTPVPDGMDFFDVDATAVAKGWLSGNITDANHLANAAEPLTFKTAESQNYINTSHIWYAEAYPKGYPKRPVAEENGCYLFGCYTSCAIKNDK